MVVALVMALVLVVVVALAGAVWCICRRVRGSTMVLELNFLN